MYYHPDTAPAVDVRPYVLAGKRNAPAQRSKLLVAYDGSSDSRGALDYAIGRARADAAAIHLVNVQEAPIDDVLVYRLHKQAGEKVLKAAVAQLDASDIASTADVAFGTVAESIVRSAALAGCDHIVVGARDRPAVASFFSPSVSSQVVRLSIVPVTVIKQKLVATTHSPRHVSSAAWRPQA
jgi:nucleotide-binding universal stress UspA family protein